MKMLPVLTLLFLSLTPLVAQTEAGQTVGSIKTESEPLNVENGLDNHVTVRSGQVAVSVSAEEALKIADWLKRATDGNYTNAPVLKVAREGDTLIVFLSPPDGPVKQFRLGAQAAAELATHLATASQNVSPQTTKS